MNQVWVTAADVLGPLLVASVGLALRRMRQVRRDRRWLDSLLAVAARTPDGSVIEIDHVGVDGSQLRMLAAPAPNPMHEYDE